MNLYDSFGRKFDYLRISLTDRCNMKCFYCLPKNKIRFFDKNKVLTLEEIGYLCTFFNKKFGIKKVRFTGGEPFLRKGFEDLVHYIRKNTDSIELCVTTNGILLEEKAKFLSKNNFKVNVSLDTLKSETLKIITGLDNIKRIIKGIDYSIHLGIPIKINTVILKNVNDSEIFDLLDFAWNRDIQIRFIEYMPISRNLEWKKYFISGEEIRKKISEKYKLEFVNKEKIAKIYKVRSNKNLKLGFIETISNPFCKDCSRLRLTSDGKIVLCLFDHLIYDIKKYLRPLIMENELTNFLIHMVKIKPAGFITLKGGYPISNPSSQLVMQKIGG